MRYLVTGGTGFIGSHLVDKLLREGHKVRVSIRKESSLKSLPVNDSNLELFLCNFLDREQLRELCSNIDTVFHLAAVTKTLNKEEYFDINVNLSKEIYMAAGAARNVSRFFFISSQAAKGPSVSKVGLKENEFTEPVSVYGMSKRRAEEELLKLSGPDKVFVYLPPVYGPGDRDFCKVFKIASTGFFLHAGLGKHHFNIIYVKDLADILYHVSQSNKVGDFAVNISDLRECTWQFFFQTLSKIFNKKIRLIYLPVPFLSFVTKVLEFFYMFSKTPPVFNCEKIKEAKERFWLLNCNEQLNNHGITAKYSLEEGLRETYKWYLEKGWL
ncbi:MAG TPA: NAD(P)-dependent oxidoreductase [Firmicutes bacterium]|mgnify:CR=1 FL=1|nr:NAD(P)-dependent oxidoreductase [Bacillota bacterium]